MPVALSVGARAPDFTLPRDGGGNVSLAQFKDRKLVIFFYPKADTSGCTAESIAFSTLLPKFNKAHTAVLGISPDAVTAVDKFKAKHKLKVALGCDPTHDMLKAYGVWGRKLMYGRTYMGVIRTTMLIGPDGRIAKIWPKVKVDGHAEEVLDATQILWARNS